MNIAYVLGYLGAEYGGVYRVAVDLGESLNRTEHCVSYWATGNEDHVKELSQSSFSVHLFDATWPKAWYYSHELVHRLKLQLKNFDLLHFHGTWVHPVYAGVKVSYKSGKPCLVTPHGTLSPWGLGRRKIKKKLYLSLFGKRIFDKAECLHAVTSYEAEDFRKIGYSGPVTIIPNGVKFITNEELPDRAHAEKHWPVLKDRQIVLFMSRLSPEKGLDMLIPVWADIVKSNAYKDALLIIAGPDDRGYKKAVEKTINLYGLQSRVLIIGMVRGHEKLALLRRADIFILPSYSENFGIVIAEALICGTPVITTTSTPWKDLQDINAGRWIKPNRHEIYLSLKELLEASESERTAMGIRGRELVAEKYCWDRIARQFITVYNCILEGKDIPLYPEPWS